MSQYTYYKHTKIIKLFYVADMVLFIIYIIYLTDIRYNMFKYQTQFFLLCRTLFGTDITIKSIYFLKILNNNSLFIRLLLLIAIIIIVEWFFTDTFYFCYDFYVLLFLYMLYDLLFWCKFFYFFCVLSICYKFIVFKFYY